MLHRGPVVITTLEEDFKKIGLLSETEKTEDEESVTPPTPKVEAKRKAKTEEDDEEEMDAEDGEEEGDEEEDDEAEESVEHDGEEMDEARRIARRAAADSRSGKLKRTKRTPPSLRMKAKRYYRKMKRKLKMAFKRKMRKPMARRRQKFLAMKRKQREGAESIANLIEDVQSIVHALDFNAGDAMKSFANIAIIADMLSNTFVEWKAGLNEAAEEENETVEYAEYDSYIESLSDLAERAADVATALKEGQVPEGGIEALEAVFKEYMADMLMGMDAYNALAEQDTMKGAKGMHVASKGEADEGDEDEDEDEEGDEAEESKRPTKR